MTGRHSGLRNSVFTRSALWDIGVDRGRLYAEPFQEGRLVGDEEDERDDADKRRWNRWTIADSLAPQRAADLLAPLKEHGAAVAEPTARQCVWGAAGRARRLGHCLRGAVRSSISTTGSGSVLGSPLLGAW